MEYPVAAITRSLGVNRATAYRHVVIGMADRHDALLPVWLRQCCVK